MSWAAEQWKLFSSPPVYPPAFISGISPTSPSPPAQKLQRAFLGILVLRTSSCACRESGHQNFLHWYKQTRSPHSEVLGLSIIFCPPAGNAGNFFTQNQTRSSDFYPGFWWPLTHLSYFASLRCCVAWVITNLPIVSATLNYPHTRASPSTDWHSSRSANGNSFPSKVFGSGRTEWEDLQSSSLHIWDSTDLIVGSAGNIWPLLHTRKGTLLSLLNSLFLASRVCKMN